MIGATPGLATCREYRFGRTSPPAATGDRQNCDRPCFAVLWTNPTGEDHGEKASPRAVRPPGGPGAVGDSAHASHRLLRGGPANQRLVRHRERRLRGVRADPVALPL